MNRGTSLLIIPFFVAFIVLFQPKEKLVFHSSKRVPSSIMVNCRNLMASILSDKSPSTWQKIVNFNKKVWEINFEKVNGFRQEYSQKIKTEGVKFEIEKSPEALLGYLDAIRFFGSAEDVRPISKLNLLQRRKLHSAFKDLSSEPKIQLQGLDQILSDLFISTYGPKIGLKDFLKVETATEKILSRVVQEDLARMGLMNTFTHFRMAELNPGRLSKFINSKKGRLLGTGLFNLPVMAGFPPLYLPGFKNLRIPEDMVQEVLENGFNKEILTKLDQKLTHSLNQEVSLNFELRERYQVLKRYYQVGIGIFLSYVLVDQIYTDSENFDKEELRLEEDIDQALGLVEDKDYLEERGYDLTQAGSDDVRHPLCDGILTCLQMEAKSTGAIPAKGSVEYDQCKELMDPDNECSEF